MTTLNLTALNQITRYGLLNGDWSPTGAWSLASLTLANTGLRLLDTGGDHSLNLVVNENLTANRVFNLIVNDGDRTLDLGGNLTVEANSIVNQDLTTDASPLFGGMTSTGNVLIQTAVNSVNAFKINRADTANVLTVNTLNWLLQMNGNSKFYHHAPGTNPGGVVIKELHPDSGGFPLMEIAGSNTAIWTSWKGIYFLNNSLDIVIGAPTSFTDRLLAKIGIFSPSTYGNAANSLYVTATTTYSAITSIKYGSSPYPDLYVSAPNIHFNTKVGAAWADGGNGLRYGTTRMTIGDDGAVLIPNATATVIPLTVQTAVSQSADAFVVQDSTTAIRRALNCVGVDLLMADQTSDVAPNDDTTLKKLSLQRLAAPPTNAAYIAFANNPGASVFYLVLEEG